MSSRLGVAWRRYAARARAAWSMTTSARWPSTSASTQIDEMSRAWAALTRTSFTRPIASASARARFWSAAANSFMKSCSPRARAQGSLQVDRAGHAVLRGVDRQLDDAPPPLVVRQRPRLAQSGAAVGAQGIAFVGVAAEVAALDHIVLGEQPGQPSHGRG